MRSRLPSPSKPSKGHEERRLRKLGDLSERRDSRRPVLFEVTPHRTSCVSDLRFHPPFSSFRGRPDVSSSDAIPGGERRQDRVACGRARCEACSCRMTSEPIGPLGLRVGQRAHRTQTVTGARGRAVRRDRRGIATRPISTATSRRARASVGWWRRVASPPACSTRWWRWTCQGPGTVFMSQALKYLAPAYLGDTLTAEVEVLGLKADKPVLSAPSRHPQPGRRDPCSRVSAGPTRFRPGSGPPAEG